jgi:long-subunit acyl-CoA synthetase (AMP-forming)
MMCVSIRSLLRLLESVEADDGYRGYAGNEEATRNTFSGSWLRTGDIMKVDEQGNFYVTDRLKEV